MTSLLLYNCENITYVVKNANVDASTNAHISHFHACCFCSDSIAHYPRNIIRENEKFYTKHIETCLLQTILCEFCNFRFLYFISIFRIINLKFKRFSLKIHEELCNFTSFAKISISQKLRNFLFKLKIYGNLRIHSAFSKCNGICKFSIHFVKVHRKLRITRTHFFEFFCNIRKGGFA